MKNGEIFAARKPVFCPWRILRQTKSRLWWMFLSKKRWSSWWLNQPIWKNMCQHGFNFRKIGVNIKNVWNHHLVISSMEGKQVVASQWMPWLESFLVDKHPQKSNIDPQNCQSLKGVTFSRAHHFGYPAARFRELYPFGCGVKQEVLGTLFIKRGPTSFPTKIWRNCVGLQASPNLRRHSDTPRIMHHLCVCLKKCVYSFKYPPCNKQR